MYDLIKDIINHSWISEGYQTGEQAYLYAASIIIIIVFSVVIIDLVRDVFSRFLR